MFKSGKGIGVFAILLAAGFLLIFFSDFSGKDEKNIENTVSEEFDFAEYESALESRLSQKINSVYGVSDSSVIVVLDSSYTYEYLEMSSGNILVCESDGNEIPVPVKRYAPKVRGVAVICKGGDDPENKKTIIQLLSSLLDIPSNKIWVGGKE